MSSTANPASIPVDPRPTDAAAISLVIPISAIAAIESNLDFADRILPLGASK